MNARRPEEPDGRWDDRCPYCNVALEMHEHLREHGRGCWPPKTLNQPEAFYFFCPQCNEEILVEVHSMPVFKLFNGDRHSACVDWDRDKYLEELEAELTEEDHAAIDLFFARMEEIRRHPIAIDPEAIT